MEQNDDIRLREFRQLKEEIRGSAQHLVVGIDIAKERHHAFFGTPMGKTLLRRLIFDNSKEGFEMLLSQAELLKTQQNLTKLVFGMEPTADYHKPLGEYLITQGHLVVLVGGRSGKEEPRTPGRTMGQERHQGCGQCRRSHHPGQVPLL